MVAKITANGFSPSRYRPFAIQCVGVRPDVPMPTTLADLRDGGISQIKLAISKLRSRRGGLLGFR